MTSSTGIFCGIYLQSAIRVIGIFDFVSALICIFACILGLYSVYQHLIGYLPIFVVLNFGVMVVINLCDAGVGLALFKYAKERNAEKLQFLFYLKVAVTSTHLVVHLIFHSSTGVIIADNTQTTYWIFLFTILLGYYAFKFGCAWVLKKFVDEIKSFGEKGNELLKNLTEEEVREFAEGTLILAGGSLDDVPPEFRPYNPEHEIESDQLEVDNACPLGEGAYGQVMRGTFWPKDSQMYQMIDGIAVAAKTSKPDLNNSQFKELLKEMKIMSFIGRHENIVSLVGCCTKNIRERQIWIVTELCELGNLFNYLRTHRQVYLHQIVDDEFSQRDNYYNVKDSLTTMDLVSLSSQIANGMQYLEKLKVIHGDLAARNILLTSSGSSGRKDGCGEERPCSLVAKITDFGLSRKLYQYSNYHKTKGQLLPWRWMAIESLRDMNFSTKSDVWSFGITIWEIFSLCEVPYPGILWSWEFLAKLSSGLRMTKPKFANKKIYNVMVNCWLANAEDRPSFDELSIFFENLYHELQSTMKK